METFKYLLAETFKVIVTLAMLLTLIFVGFFISGAAAVFILSRGF